MKGRFRRAGGLEEALRALQLLWHGVLEYSIFWRQSARHTCRVCFSRVGLEAWTSHGHSASLPSTSRTVQLLFQRVAARGLHPLANSSSADVVIGNIHEVISIARDGTDYIISHSTSSERQHVHTVLALTARSGRPLGESIRNFPLPKETKSLNSRKGDALI